MTTLERLQTALSGLGLTGIEARLEVLLQRASKQESAYGDFLLEVVSAEVEARRQRYSSRCCRSSTPIRYFEDSSATGALAVYQDIRAV